MVALEVVEAMEQPREPVEPQFMVVLEGQGWQQELEEPALSPVAVAALEVIHQALAAQVAQAVFASGLGKDIEYELCHCRGRRYR